jgi:DNA-binding XRE family transcriptional regulator
MPMLQISEGKLIYGALKHAPAKAPRTIQDLDNLPALLRTYRARRKLSCAATARLIGVSYMTYWRWETKGQRPNIYYRKRIVSLLHRASIPTARIKQAKQLLDNAKQSSDGV